jgi:hypothetical protein
MRLSIVECRLSNGRALSRGLRPARLRARAWILYATVLLLSLVPIGCRERGSDSKDAKATAPGVSRTAHEGPVTVTVTAKPAELPFNERAEVLVEVIAESGVTVDVDDYERSESLAAHQFEYRVTPLERKAAVPTNDGKLKWTYRYGIEFFLPGRYELPAAAASFVDARQTPDSAMPVEAHKLTTEPLAVVARDPNAKPLTPEELKTITALPPVELREPWSRWWWAAPPIVVAAALLIAALVRRSRRRQQIVVPIPAHEWANQQIAALVAEDLVRKGQVQEFYYRISDIVRGYVERRFGVSAPEMTTEEFLAAAASDGRFGERNTAELNAFLNACDLVKYARQLPRAGEADVVLRAAGGFVERTRESLYRTDRNGSPATPTMERAA